MNNPQDEQYYGQAPTTTVDHLGAKDEQAHQPQTTSGEAAQPQTTDEQADQPQTTAAEECGEDEYLQGEVASQSPRDLAADPPSEPAADTVGGRAWDPESALAPDPDGDVVVAEIADVESGATADFGAEQAADDDAGTIAGNGGDRGGATDLSPMADWASPMAESRAAGMEAQWHDIQAAFVDNPRGAVALAGDAAESAVSALAGRLRDHRSDFSSASADSPNRDTERLRFALQQYRQLCQAIDALGLQLPPGSTVTS